MKNIAVLGTDGNALRTAFNNTDEVMRQVGKNCGNLIFQYAIRNLIKDKTLIVGQEIGYDPQIIQENCKALVIPSANFIREAFDLSPVIDLIKEINIPTLFIGLGASANNHEQKKFNYHESIYELFDILKNKEITKGISIRDENTANILKENNIYNYKITGCPSNLINRSRYLGDIILKNLNSEPEFFLSHCDEPWICSKEKSSVNKKLCDWLLTKNGLLIQQAVPEVIRLLRGDDFKNTQGKSQEEKRRHFSEALRKTWMPKLTEEEFRSFLKLKCRTYFSADQWLEDSMKFDFSLGLRLHGNMAAWQAGVPSLWITHDNRTKGLVNTMKLPSISCEEFIQGCPDIISAWQLLRMKFDSNAYTKNRMLLEERFNQIFEKYEIKYEKIY